MPRVTFDQALGETLTSVASGMRAGLSFDQAFATSAASARKIVKAEANRVLAAIRSGESRADAFAALAERRPSPNMEFLATGLQLSELAGGNLAQVLDTIAQTIRDRTHLEQDLRSATAQARSSSYVLAALPVLLVVIVSIIQPQYYQSVWSSPIGLLILLVAAAFTIVGLVFMRGIIRSALR
jgi:tight adherence protein B